MIYNRVIQTHFRGDFFTLELHICATSEVIKKIDEFVSKIVKEEPKKWEEDEKKKV